MRATTSTRWNLVVLLAVTGAFAALAWTRRWVSDDGLIVTRTVRQLLAGDGPVFNAGERVEANTSTLWTYLLALVGAVVDVDLVRLSVWVGLVLSVVAVAVAVDASRRLHAGAPGSERLLPLGALVVLGLPPFWDFATSGLETGLVFAWLSTAYWSLVVSSRAGAAGSRRGPLVAVLLGLGPLVRPELAVASAVLLLALWWRRGAGLRAGVLLLAAGIALPVAYQVFRMGYYGVLVPQTAIAKSAGAALWDRGLVYLLDLVAPYALVVPLVLVGAATVLLLARGARSRDRADLVLVAAPLVVALVLATYVLRVGGDFMHARMLLPPLLLVLLPVFVVPLSRLRLALVIGAAVWALVSAVALRPDYASADPPLDLGSGIADERAFWASSVGEANPTTAAPFVASFHALATEVAEARPQGLVWRNRSAQLPVAEQLPWDVAVVTSIAGTGGSMTQLDEAVLDPLGLTYPLAAHIELGARDRPGHEKVLPDSWIAADAVQPGAALFPDGPSPQEVAAAREALGCGDLAEMQDSVRAPLTPERFVANLLGAPHRTSLTIPRDPAQAVAELCP